MLTAQGDAYNMAYRLDAEAGSGYYSKASDMVSVSIMPKDI